VNPRDSAAARHLIQPPTIRNLLIWHDEYHLPVTVGETEYQYLRHELADLLGREDGRERTNTNTL